MILPKFFRAKSLSFLRGFELSSHLSSVVLVFRLLFSLYSISFRDEFSSGILPFIASSFSEWCYLPARLSAHWPIVPLDYRPTRLSANSTTSPLVYVPTRLSAHSTISPLDYLPTRLSAHSPISPLDYQLTRLSAHSMIITLDYNPTRLSAHSTISPLV